MTAWALAQVEVSAPSPDAALPAARNLAPEVVTNAPGQELTVRAGNSIALTAEALDPDVAQDGGFEAVWLAAELEPGFQPEWLEGLLRFSGPSEKPGIEIDIAPPANAQPGRFAIRVGATDSRGLTTIRVVRVTVLSPACPEPADYLEDGACRQCPEHQVSNDAGTGCEPCPAETERPAGAKRCTECPPSVSEAGPDRCAKPPPAAIFAKAGTKSGTMPPTIVATVKDGPMIAESAGKVNVRLTLENPPDTEGGYTGCRLRLGSGSVAETPADVTFSNQKKLNADNGWSAQAKLLTIVDDALAEGNESLVVEGHCTGSKRGTVPAHGDLVSQPLTLTITDNDQSKPMRLSVDPERIGETLGQQRVTVAAEADEPLEAAATVHLTLGNGSYVATGTREIVIAAGERAGSTQLTITPSDDGNATDDALAIDGAAPGFDVAATTLTIDEPVLVNGVDLSGLGVALSISPTAIREGTGGTHGITATLTGVPVPAVDVAMVLMLGGTATEGAAHDFTLKGGDNWKALTVAANDAHLSANTSVRVVTRADSVEEGIETVTFSVAQITWGTTVLTPRQPGVATLRITEAWDAPPAPAGLSAVPAPGDETHGLDVTWEAVKATPPVEGYRVRYREVAAPPASWLESDLQPGQATSVTGLNAGTRYEMRVLAQNAAGRGAESGSIYAYTAEGPCQVGAPRVTSADGTRSATELEVSWETPVCTQAVASYRVGYRLDPNVEMFEEDWSEHATATAMSTLRSLTPDTAYVVRVRAVATGGDRGPWSALGRGRTGLDTRLPPRVGAPAVEPNADAGGERLDATWPRVTWTDENDIEHPIDRYQYRYRAAGGGWTEPTDAQASATETAAMTRTLAGLASGIWHEVQVRGVNWMAGVAYPGKWSEPGRGRTWGVPDQVEEPAAYLTGTGVGVIWEAPDSGGAAITDYDVEYKTQDSRKWTTHPYAGCGNGACETSTAIAAAAKKVRVRAGNSVGAGAWSPTAKVRQQKLLRISFAGATAEVNEGESLLATVELDSAADRPLTVPLTTTGDEDAFRLDGAANGEIAFGLGTDEQTFTLVALQDADRDDETVTLGFGQLPDGVLLKAPASLTVTINDDEPRNASPVFPQGASATRTVAENSAAGTAVGAAVAATDADNDPLTYSLAGTDANRFAIDPATGQIAVGEDAALNYEDAPSPYALLVRVSDGKDVSGQDDASVDATIAVTVNVSDVDEAPSAPDAPTLVAGTTALDVSWNEPANTGPPILSYALRYRASGEAGWNDVSLESLSTGSKLSNLSAGTAHEVQVRAANDEGTGDWSASAWENTLPAVSVSADATHPVIGADGAAATVVLSGSGEAAGGGDLSGRWLRRAGDGTESELGEWLPLTSGMTVTSTVSSAAPGAQAHGFRVRLALDGRTREATRWVNVDWLPSVSLSASPASVDEDGGSADVTVTASLSGSTVTDRAKTVTVSVAGGTAKAGDDFEAVADFTIPLAGGERSASAVFSLKPVADEEKEKAETIALTGTAAQGMVALPVAGTSLTLEDSGRLRLKISPRPTGGYLFGGGINCGSGERTDCEASFEPGTFVVLEATPDPGKRVSSWSRLCISITTHCPVEMTKKRTGSVSFGTARTLTVAAPENGEVVGRIQGRQVIGCGSDCSVTSADGHVVKLQADGADGYGFDGWSGACAAATAATCSVPLDADKSVGVAFVLVRADGVCDPGVVDGCESGTANNTAFSDTPTHHQWRCDGIGGGADSDVCRKEKAGCESATLQWTVEPNACVATVAAASHGATAAANDGGASPNGTATFACDDGSWTVQAGATCAPCDRVDGGWSTSHEDWSACSATACGQTGTRTRDWTRACTNPEPSCGGSACSGPTSGTAEEACFGSDCGAGTYCGEGACVAYPGVWVKENPGACSASQCGAAGTQSVSARCANGPCDPLTKPPATQACHGDSCPNGQHCAGTGAAGACANYDRWSTGAWSACSATSCGSGGTQTRAVSCSGTCDPAAKPDDSQACEGSACPGSETCRNGACQAYPGTWVTEHPGSCSATACGAAGTQTVRVRCANGPCDPQAKPPNTRACHGRSCAGNTYCRGSGSSGACTAYDKWSYGKWSACSATTCGTSGTETRTVTCAGTCNPATKPQGQRSCQGTTCADGKSCNGSGQCVCPYGTELCGGSCVPVCGTNERRASGGCGCECLTAYHRDSGACVQNPACGASTPPKVNSCSPTGAKAVEKKTTAKEDGVCRDPNKPNDNKCTGGKVTKEGTVKPMGGQCGDKRNECKYSTAITTNSTDSTFTWVCPGKAGRVTWQCQGTDELHTWKCMHGRMTTENTCETGGEAATSADCNEPDPDSPATSVSCEICTPDYERYPADGPCVKKCGENEVRVKGVCECKKKHKKFGDKCQEAFQVTIQPKPAKGYVDGPDGDGDGISCGSGNRNNCSEYYIVGTTVTLTPRPDSGYEFGAWTNKAVCGDSASCSTRGALETGVSFNGTLMVDPGGNRGVYHATHIVIPPPLGGASFYTAGVQASASKGVSPYTLEWQDSRTGATAVYIFVNRGTYKRKVTAKDADGNTAKAEATIHAGTSTSASDSAQGGSGASSVAIPVPLGGSLHLIWGEDGDVSAKSLDETVVTVAVSSPAVEVAGIGLGETEVSMRTDQGELRIPVVVQ